MSDRWRAIPRAVHTRTHRGGVILDPITKAYYELNQTGDLVWRRLEQGASRGELVEALCSEFEVSHEIAQRDIDQILGELAGAKLIRPATAE